MGGGLNFTFSTGLSRCPVPKSLQSHNLADLVTCFMRVASPACSEAEGAFETSTCRRDRLVGGTGAIFEGEKVVRHTPVKETEHLMLR